MANLSHSTPVGQEDILLGTVEQVLYRVKHPPKPRSKKKIFPHLGSTVLVEAPKDMLQYLYHPIQRVVRVLWTLSKTPNAYQNIEFHTNYGREFYLDAVRGDCVEVLSPRKQILIGFDTYYKDKRGKTIHEQLIHPNGDYVFEGMA